MSKVAIVKTIISGTAVVHIDDSCCTGLSPEEVARRWAEVDRAIWMINRNHQQRMREQQEKEALEKAPSETGETNYEKSTPSKGLRKRHGEV